MFRLKRVVDSIKHQTLKEISAEKEQEQSDHEKYKLE